MSRLFALFLAVLALGLVSGCGDDDDDGGGDAAETTEQPADTARRGGHGRRLRPAATSRSGWRASSSIPTSVTVKAGGTVKWTNNESVPHDVTKEDGPGADFSSGKGNMMQGDTYKQTFKEAGTVNYVCTIHPNMKGTVEVE